jgi:hypothetical protein
VKVDARERPPNLTSITRGLIVRLITKDLHRAFPELDRFDEANARAFVKSANRRFVPRAIRFLLMATVMIGAALLGLNFSWNAYFRIRSDVTAILLTGLTVIPFIALGAILTLLLRDVLLRRSIQRLIDRRGTCFKCGYSLLGMIVGPDFRVTCPECQSITRADTVLNELVPDAHGRQTYQPSIDQSIAEREERTRRRLKTVAKWMAYCTLALIATALVAILASTPLAEFHRRAGSRRSHG